MLQTKCTHQRDRSCPRTLPRLHLGCEMDSELASLLPEFLRSCSESIGYLWGRHGEEWSWNTIFILDKAWLLTELQVFITFHNILYLYSCRYCKLMKAWSSSAQAIIYRSRYRMIKLFAQFQIALCLWNVLKLNIVFTGVKSGGVNCKDDVSRNKLRQDVSCVKPEHVCINRISKDNMNDGHLL